MYNYEDCMLYLNHLDNIGYDTMWIRYLWKLKGMTNQWCIDKCKEIIEHYNLDDPTEIYKMNKKLADEIGKAYVRLHCKQISEKENKPMIEILENNPTDHTQILKTLNAFLSKIDRTMYVDATYDIDMDTDVITISISAIQLSYRFTGNLHAQTLTDMITSYGITRTTNNLYATVRNLILNEIYLKIFQKPIDE